MRYFVIFLELEWEAENFMTQAARCQDTLERQDAVAKTRKKGWSEEIVMEELWKSRLVLLNQLVKIADDVYLKFV